MREEESERENEKRMGKRERERERERESTSKGAATRYFAPVELTTLPFLLIPLPRMT